MAEIDAELVELNGLPFRYSLAGDGEEVVVLVGGLGDTIEGWAFQVGDLLAAGFRVLCFDNRGAGGSPTTPGPYTTRLLADDARALTAELGLAPFHLVGASLGGMIAQEYALAHRDDLRSLTLAFTCARPPAYTARLLALWDDLARSCEDGLELVLRDALLHGFTPDVFERPELVATLEQGFEPAQSLEGFLAQLAAARSHDALGRLGGIAARTLVVAAARDAIVPAAASAELAGAIAGAELLILEGGHGCAWTEAAAFDEDLVRFLREAGGGEPALALTDRLRGQR